MNPTPNPTPAKIRPSFKLSIAIITSCVWLCTFAYAKSPDAQQTALTFAVYFLIGLLIALSTLSRSSPFMRAFVFTSTTWNQEADQKTMGIIFYALSLLTCFFIWR